MERRRPRVQTVNDMDSRTQQSDVHGSEIRHILAKYAQTGVVDQMRNVDLQFMDVSEFSDFHDMALQTKTAENVFNALPSKLREVFGHSVYKWLDAAHDPRKLEALRPKLEKLGVYKAAAPADVVPEVAPAAVITPVEGSGTPNPETESTSP